MSKSPTRVFLVRHGATVLTAEDRFAGATNVQLSDEGRSQAGRLAVRLAERENLPSVYASPTGSHGGDGQHPRRAAQAGDPEARRPARNLPRPLGGMTRKEVDAKYPEEAPSGRRTPTPSRPAVAKAAWP